MGAAEQVHLEVSGVLWAAICFNLSSRRNKLREEEMLLASKNKDAGAERNL